MAEAMPPTSTPKPITEISGRALPAEGNGELMDMISAGGACCTATCDSWGAAELRSVRVSR